ncbi:hypothetical protein BN135_4226 [Cronobacter muytjensii 530]
MALCALGAEVRTDNRYRVSVVVFCQGAVDVTLYRRRDFIYPCINVFAQGSE